jgi:hypothetical protein
MDGIHVAKLVAASCTSEVSIQRRTLQGLRSMGCQCSSVLMRGSGTTSSRFSHKYQASGAPKAGRFGNQSSRPVQIHSAARQSSLLQESLFLLSLFIVLDVEFPAHCTPIHTDY